MTKERGGKKGIKRASQELFEAFLSLKNVEEVERFLRDLCTPQELQAFSERWRVCQLLSEENLSYREINEVTGASLVTIGRVARFLKNESYHGYALVLERTAEKRRRLSDGK